MRRLAIINPASGNSRIGRLQQRIIDRLKSVADDCFITRYPGHCKEAAREASEYDGLIAVGGDGTVGEVINGMDLDRQNLAIIPTGTGNSLARDFGMRTIESGIDRARNGKPVTIDLIQFYFVNSQNGIQRRYGASTASVGYAARVTQQATRRFKSLGALCYPAASLACVLGPQRFKTTISYDNGPSFCTQLTCIMVQNARHAANFELFPTALVNDGFFDVMELSTSAIQQITHNISVLSKLPFYRPGILRRIKSMHLTNDAPQLLMIDGELFPDVSKVQITICQGKLKCYR